MRLDDGYYILRGREVVKATMEENHLQRIERRTGDEDRWRVARETLGDCDVSTVFLGIDHQYGDGPPLLFETMIFGGDYSDHHWRYATYDEAEAGHSAVVEALRNGDKLPGYEDQG